MQDTFRNSAAGFIPTAALLVIVFAVGSLTPHFLMEVNWQNILMQFVVYAALACGMALGVRANGPDLSVGATMGISILIIGAALEAGVPLVGSLLLALLAAGGIGLANGFVTTRTRFPAVAMTIAVCIILKVITRMLMMRQWAPLTDLRGIMQSVGPVFLIGVLAAGVVLVMFTSLGTPFLQRGKGKDAAHIFAYVYGGVAAACAGFFLLSRVGSAMVASGNYIVFLVAAAAALYSSRKVDNRWAPVLYAALIAFLWCALNNVMVLVNLSAYFQLVATILIAAVYAAVAFVCRGKELLRR